MKELAMTTWSEKDGYTDYCSKCLSTMLDERTLVCSRCNTAHERRVMTEEDFCDLKNRSVGA